jgi:hypothetical protein
LGECRRVLMATVLAFHVSSPNTKAHRCGKAPTFSRPVQRPVIRGSRELFESVQNPPSLLRLTVRD